MILPMWMPPIPAWNTKPITLYSYMDSIVNYGKAENEKKKLESLQHTQEQLYLILIIHYLQM
jgi:hypothetical protein